MASQMSAPALDLSTDIERPFVRINSLDYDVRVVDDFTAIELRQLDRMLPRVLPLANKLETGDPTDAECEELSALLVELLKLAIAAPVEVLQKLGDVQKVRVFRVFIDLLPVSLRRARASLEANRNRGASSSLGSSGSTAATSARGKRRSR